jgi:hypothetical protein
MRIRDLGWKNSDLGWKKFGSGINIPDLQYRIVHGSRSGISKKVLNPDPGFWASWIRIH